MRFILDIQSLETSANLLRLQEILGDRFDEEKEKIQKQAAAPLKFQIERNAPIRTGLLRYNIEYLTFPKSFALFIGPKLKRKQKPLSKRTRRRFIGGSANRSSNIPPRIDDPYYAGIVESGVKLGKNKFPGRFYVKRALNSLRGIVNKRLARLSLELIEKLGKQAVR